MPAIDALDQQAARAFETQLYDAVARQERPPVELEWFSALPKRIRRSARLLEVAQAEAKALLEFARASWSRTRGVERERAERLTRAQALPRDLESLRSPDSAAWNGLGRRKRRCRAFDAVGRAFTARQRVSEATSTFQPTSTPKSALADQFSLDQDHSPSPPSTPDSASRPATPEGLREAAFSCLGLLASASGINAYGHNTPRPLPLPQPRIIRRPPEPVAPPEPFLAYEGETVVGDMEVDWRIAYLIARGRWEGCKWAPCSSLREAAQDVLCMEEMAPGVLAFLLDFFFPHGLDDWSLARPKMIFIRDICLGWYSLAP